ncbi:stage III sporulation protein AF [Effusibacillus pohliae]|uniref:stage III sporulation protein AF n=1 Tax=Effusibacillus pohliae TaxID=232270 RepID=UPI00036D90C5|nr:stage III sporulation protein AF [Effusibacillus pohliae]
MSFLSSWLSQIVLILLFAVVMDLIVPASAMRNYVKLVMGLVIMVTMLKPISALYHGQFDISRIRWPDTAAQVAGFDSIRSKAAEIQRDQLRLAEQKFSEQLEQTIKQQIESAYPLEVAKVQAWLADSANEPGQARTIEQLNVWVRPQSNGRAGSGIEPVQPVVIGPDAARETVRQQADAENEKLLQQIRETIANRLQIPHSVISVQMESQARG